MSAFSFSFDLPSVSSHPSSSSAPIAAPHPEPLPEVVAAQVVAAPTIAWFPPPTYSLTTSSDSFSPVVVPELIGLTYPSSNSSSSSVSSLPLRRCLQQPTPSRIDETSDLTPGVYEGGLKVWECSIDLVSFMRSREGLAVLSSALSPGAADRVPPSVLELGCGHALPAVHLYRSILQEAKASGRKEGARLVLSDFNEEVFGSAAVPNLVAAIGGGDHQLALSFPSTEQQLDGDEDVAVGGVRCYYGDWHGLPSSAHDVVIASETTYSLSSCRSTVQLLAKHLKSTTGVGLVATKRFYFGVGGGAAEFRSLCEGEGLEVDEGATVVVDRGDANIREVIVVRKKKQKGTANAKQVGAQVGVGP